MNRKEGGSVTGRKLSAGNRRGVYQILAALLYMGPLLAGLAGFGWQILPPFLFVFLLWLYILHPQQWPQGSDAWRGFKAPLAVLTLMLSQMLLIVVLLVIGRGIGAVAGQVLPVNPFMPLALSFAAPALVRLFWDPARALREGLCFDEMVTARSRQILVSEEAEDMVDQLLAASEREEGEVMLDLVISAMESDEGWLHQAELSAVLSVLPETRHRALREAVIAWAVASAEATGGAAPGAVRLGFAAAGGNAALLGQLLPPMLRLAEAGGGPADRFPEPLALDAMARRFTSDQEIASLILRLAAALRLQRAPLGRGASLGPATVGEAVPSAAASQGA